MFMNNLVFGHFGKPGATIIFSTLYIISLIFLTNFHLGHWLRKKVTERSVEDDEPETENKNWSPEEKVLAKKARDLEKQAKRLQDQLEKDKPKEKDKEKSGLGADGRPVPVPTVRDLSVPTARTGKPGKSRLEEPAIEAGDLEGEVIPATEIAAATTADVLGKGADLAKKGGRADKSKSGRGEPEEATDPDTSRNGDPVEAEKL